jgi:predicted HTH domain antitoxin
VDKFAISSEQKGRSKITLTYISRYLQLKTFNFMDYMFKANRLTSGYLHLDDDTLVTNARA